MRAPTLFVAVVALVLTGSVRAQEPTTAEEYLKRGDEHKNAYAMDKAIADYTKALELNKNLVQARRQRAQSYSWIGKYTESAADYTSIIQAVGGDVATYIARANVYSALGKPDQALADFTSAIEFDPRSAEAYTARAWYYTGQANHDKALADFDKLVELHPTAASYSARANFNRYNRKDHKAAITDYTTLIGLEPQVAYRYTDRAFAYTEKKEWDSAIADYTKAIGIEPKSSYHFSSRAFAYLQKDRLDDAIADYTTAISLYSSDAHTYLCRAEAAKRKGQTELAVADFNKSIELNPWNAGRIYLYQSKLLPDVFQYDTTAIVTEATKAIDQNPKDATAYIRRAAMNHLNWQMANAVSDYTAALKLAPERAAAIHICRGAVYHSQGRYASVVADFREALQLDPQVKLGEALLNAAIAKMAEYKSVTSVESVRLDEEVFFVKTSVERMTLPDGAKKTIKKTLTTRHEVTVADVRRMDVEVRAAIKQKQESSSGSSSSSSSSDSTTGGGGGSVGLGVFSFSGNGGRTWGSGSESGYSSSTLTGWESEFGTSIRTGMEKSRTFSSSVESSEEVGIEPVGKGKDQPFLVIYQDKYRSGTAKLKINGVIDEVRFAFPVGKDLTWEYAEKPKTEDKK